MPLHTTNPTTNLTEMNEKLKGQKVKIPVFAMFEGSDHLIDHYATMTGNHAFKRLTTSRHGLPSKTPTCR